MNNEQTSLVRNFVSIIDSFNNCVQQEYPAGLMDWVPPSIPDAWTIREHILHTLDADLMLHHRIRYAIAQPGTEIMIWEQDAWKASLHYKKQPVVMAVSLLKMLRSMTASLFNELSPEVWEKSYSVHPIKGKMTLEAWLKMYTEHAQVHLDYIARNEKAWQDAGMSASKPCS